MRHLVARRVKFGTALVHSSYGNAVSQWTCRPRARDAGKANSYQWHSDVVGEFALKRIYMWTEWSNPVGIKSPQKQSSLCITHMGR